MRRARAGSEQPCMQHARQSVFVSCTSSSEERCSMNQNERNIAATMAAPASSIHDAGVPKSTDIRHIYLTYACAVSRLMTTIVHAFLGSTTSYSSSPSLQLHLWGQSEIRGYDMTMLSLFRWTDPSCGLGLEWSQQFRKRSRFFGWNVWLEIHIAYFYMDNLVMEY